MTTYKTSYKDLLIESILVKNKVNIRENINVSKVMGVSIKPKVDHILFEVFLPGGDIRAFFYDKSNNEVQFPSIECGKISSNDAKKLFSTNDNKIRDNIMNGIVKQLQNIGINKLKTKSYLAIHDNPKKYII